MRIAVIGAGMGGLSAAAILARHADVEVFERAAVPGGKMRQITIEGRAIDSGPTVFTMDWALEKVFAAAGARLEEQVRLMPLDILARHAWPDGGRLDLFADAERSAAAIEDFSGSGEGARYLEFCAKTKRVFQTLKAPFLLSERPSMTGLLTQASPLALLGSSPFSTLWAELSKSFTDPRLVQLFGRYATYCGASPFEAPATLMLIAHVEQAGVWALDGGMQALAAALADVAEANGARLRYGADVEEVIVENGGARGLALASGERIEADAVISNSDAAALATGALGPGATSAVRLPGDVQRSQSAMTWSLLGEVTGIDLAMHTVIFSDDYKAEFDAVFARGEVPARPTVYICAPDRARGTAPTGEERLFCLINAPANGDNHTYTEEEIAACRQRLTDQLARCGISLSDRPGAEIVTTPSDFAAMFPATGGALYGMASHGWQASFQRPGVRSRLKGLYLAGGSVHPGPGVPMAALSGRAAARALAKDFALTSM